MAEQITNTQQPEGAPAPAQQPAAPNYDELFTRLDSILEKRSEGLAKSALKDNGIDESEIADIVRAYREQKQTKATEQANALTQANETIATLQKQIAEKTIDDALTAAALELGIDAKQLPYVARLASRDGILGADNQPDAEKVKAAINQVLEDVPALKASATGNKGFVPVGTKTGEGADSGADAEKKLRSYFGLK